MQNFLSKRQRGCPLASPKNHIHLDSKKGLIFGIFSSSIVDFSYARGRATPKSYLHILKHIKTKIGPEIKHFQVVKCKIFIGRAGMQPPKNKFRLKRCLKLSIW